jgi:1-deoxy-D-xylulose-5-phosphate synthase
MRQIRHTGGISGFPKRSESEYDTFGVGHSSTSISAALGMAIAARAQNASRRTVAVIGDGGMTAGMAYEAMSHAGEARPNMLLILNDNQMSISNNTGGLHNYFARIWSSKLYASLRAGGKRILRRLPAAWELIRRTEVHAKGMVAPGVLFEELGLNYIGPLDGHDLPMLLRVIENIRDRTGPQFLHVLTVKGKGYERAEESPIAYHAISKISSPTKKSASSSTGPKYQDVFGQWLCDTAPKHPELIGITPAMCEGSGMQQFRDQFPHQFQDVAIAEQHAITLAAGLACEGMKPIVSIYSTFLQRGYDQLIHDVALQNLDVLFAIDRAGLVGEDGPTHAGVFDLSYMRCVPGMVIATPSDATELVLLLNTGFMYSGPFAVRYPRGTAPEHPDLKKIGNSIKQPIGKSILRRKGRHTALLVFGPLLDIALDVADSHNYTVVDMRFVKPLDGEMILELSKTHQRFCTLEDHALSAGAGSSVGEYLHDQQLRIPLVRMGVPDNFIEHGTRAEQLSSCGLDSKGIEKALSRSSERISA